MSEPYQVGVALALGGGISASIEHARRYLAGLDRFSATTAFSVKQLQAVGLRAMAPHLLPAARVLEKPELSGVPPIVDETRMVSGPRTDWPGDRVVQRESLAPARLAGSEPATANVSATGVADRRIATVSEAGNPAKESVREEVRIGPARTTEIRVTPGGGNVGASNSTAFARLGPVRPAAPERRVPVSVWPVQGAPVGPEPAGALRLAEHAQTYPGGVVRSFASPLGGRAAFKPASDWAGLRSGVPETPGGSDVASQVASQAAPSGPLPYIGGPAGPGILGAQMQNPAAPAMPPASQSGQMPGQGDVFLDGMLVGRWISKFLAQEAGRAQVGPTGFDARRSRLLPGATVGG